MTNFMLAITFLGSGLALLSLSIVLLFLIAKYRSRDALIYLAIFYSAILLNLILKTIYQRPRPDNLPLIHESTLSFPSGHAMNGFVFFMALTYFVFREIKNVKIGVVVGIFSIIIVSLIGISRIYLGAHYLSDVIGGFVTGFFWFISAIIFEKIIIARRYYQDTKK